MVHLPERLRLLLIGAATRQGCRARPRVDIYQRIVLKYQPDLGVLWQQAAQRFMQAAADRALKVRELDYGDGGVGVPRRWRALDIQLGAVLGEHILVHIVQFAAHDELAVFADPHLGVFFVLADGQINVGLQQSRNPGLLEVPNGQFHVWPEREVVSQIHVDLVLQFARGRALGRTSGREQSIQRHRKNCRQAYL